MPEQLIVFTNHIVIGSSDDEGDDHISPSKPPRRGGLPLTAQIAEAVLYICKYITMQLTELNRQFNEVAYSKSFLNLSSPFGGQGATQQRELLLPDDSDNFLT